MTAAIDMSAAGHAGHDRVITWPRVRLWLVVTLLWAVFRALISETAFPVWLVRCAVTTAPAVLAYAVLDRWPRRLPSWAPRWILQLLAIVAVMPPGVYLSYVLTEGTWDIVALGDRYQAGLAINIFIGIFLGPWIALGALLRRSEAFAREQALAFQLKSSELERKALDSRLKLLQAQVEPHFLFNTLANIRALVRKSGSAEAASLLDSLIVYLRAAVPRLDADHYTVGQEQQTVRAYLELMQMRMPDRLQYTVDVEPHALSVQCPPMILLTLVENAIKHGIDPGESGGSVDVRVTLRGGRVHVRVADTGVGLRPGKDEGSGTGLQNLRERLTLAFGEDARVSLRDGEPRGTVAELEFPARSRAPS